MTLGSAALEFSFQGWHISISGHSNSPIKLEVEITICLLMVCYTSESTKRINVLLG